MLQKILLWLLRGHVDHELVIFTFKGVGIELRWEGEGVNEKGLDIKTEKC